MVAIFLTGCEVVSFGGNDFVNLFSGGGGMLSGCSIAARGWNDIHHRGERPLLIFGAEPQGADDAFRSFSSGEWVPQLSPKTIAGP